MTTAEEIQNAYVDYVLTQGRKPKSVYAFAKENNLSEAEFYNFYGSFEAIEETIWTNLITIAITEVQSQEVWEQYSSREKTLAFFYGFIELLKTKRSFALYTLKNSARTIGTPQVLKGVKNAFEDFTVNILQQGIETRELADRRFFSDRYKDALWVQFGLVLSFWAKDKSSGFEKTDVAIEKGINATFDLFERSPLDSLIDYGKFMVTNGGLKSNMKF